MLHAKFQDHMTSSSGEDFKMFLPYMGVAVILVIADLPVHRHIPVVHES